MTVLGYGHGRDGLAHLAKTVYKIEIVISPLKENEIIPALLYTHKFSKTLI